MVEPRAFTWRSLNFLGPTISLAVLAIVIVAAVVVGNLQPGWPEGCWPADRGDAAGDQVQGWPVMVWSSDADELMLCDVGADEVKYQPPERIVRGVLLNKGMLRIDAGDEVVLPDDFIVNVEGNDLVRSEPSILLYKKGVFGEVEDCYGDTYDLEDNEGIWSEDPLGVYSDPDNVQSCWMEFEYFEVADLED